MLVMITLSVLQCMFYKHNSFTPFHYVYLTIYEDINQPAPVRKPIEVHRPIDPDVLRENHGKICDALNVSEDSLQSFTLNLFGAGIIGKDTKISVIRTGGKKGADTLLDHINLKVEHNPDCLHVVLELMEKDEYLSHIAKKIKGEIEDEEILITTIQSLQSYIILSSQKQLEITLNSEAIRVLLAVGLFGMKGEQACGYYNHNIDYTHTPNYIPFSINTLHTIYENHHDHRKMFISLVQIILRTSTIFYLSFPFFFVYVKFQLYFYAP